jgi:hypothetical protein
VGSFLEGTVNLLDGRGRWIRERGNFFTFLLVITLSILWWKYLAVHCYDVPRITGVSLASFILGALIGFLFTSYGEEEAASIGKLRDWLLAAITGISLVNAAKLRAGLEYIAGNDEPTKSMLYCVAVVYLGVGFLLMFFQRSLILNTIVARARVERVRIANMQSTASVVQRAMAVLPATLLSGIQDADEITDSSKKAEAKRLEEVLYSPDVEKFLGQVDDAVRSGSCDLNWDVVSKVAFVNYYRSYFDRDPKPVQISKAIEWISRALVLNPLHSDLTMKLADMQAATGHYDTACTILTQLSIRPESPVLVHQWLGYYYLFVPGKEVESISQSDAYLSFFPNDANTHLNKARAYAQEFALEAKKGTDRPDLKDECLKELRRALQNDARLYLHITKTLKEGKNYSFGDIEVSKYGKEFIDVLAVFAPK